MKPIAMPLAKMGNLKTLAKAMNAAVETALDSAALVAESALKQPTKTWNHKPKWAIVQRSAERLVGTDDPPYKFVTRGTRVRYAVLTPGFSPKTTPGSLGAKAGAGGVMFISRKHPRPGIKARGFEELAVQVVDKQIGRIFKTIITTGLPK